MAEIVCLAQRRLTLARRTLEAQAAELVETSTDLVEALQLGVQRLQVVHDHLAVALAKVDAGNAFRQSCRNAWELDDLDEMIRRRDALARDLARAADRSGRVEAQTIKGP